MFRNKRKDLFNLDTQLFNDYLISINNGWNEDTKIIEPETAYYLENKIYEAIIDEQKITSKKIHNWAKREQGYEDFSDIMLDNESAIEDDLLVMLKCMFELIRLKEFTIPVRVFENTLLKIN